MPNKAVYIKPREPVHLMDFIASSKADLNESISRSITSIINEQVTVTDRELQQSTHRSEAAHLEFYEVSISTAETPTIMTVAISPAECRRLCALSFGSTEEWNKDTAITLTPFERSFCLLLLTAIARQLSDIFSRRLDHNLVVSSTLTHNAGQIDVQQRPEFIMIHFVANTVARAHDFFVTLNSKCIEQLFENRSMEGRTRDEVGNWQRALHARVNEIPVPVSALIRFSIEAGALSQVQSGQVIKIPGSSWRKATLLAKTFEAYTGQIGRDEDRVTFRVA